MYEPNYEIAYGSKYERDLDVKEIAKLVRKGIKAAIKSGELPELKASVKISRFSGGCSLRVSVKEVSFPLTNPEWAVWKHYNPDVYRGPFSQYTEQAEKVQKFIKKLVASYNYDGSDSMVDYFNVNFYGQVDYDWQMQGWDEKAALELAAANAVPPTPEPTPEPRKATVDWMEPAKPDNGQVAFLKQLGAA